MTDRRRDLTLLAAWTALVVALFADVLFFGRTLFREDFSLYEFPQHLITARALGAGTWPEWNDWLHLGLPHLANPTTAVFYPPTWLDVLDVVSALNARVALHVWLAGVGAWLLARRLGAGRPGATLAALSFALGGPLLGTSDNPFYLASGAWTPVVLWAWLHALAGPSPRRAAVGAGLALALQVLAGDPQAALCSGAWMLLLAVSGRGDPEGGVATGSRVLSWRRVAASGALTLAVAAGISAVQWLPSAIFLAGSVRVGGAAVDEVLSVWALHPLRLVNLLLPNAFGAPVPVNTLWAYPLTSDGRLWFSSLYAGALALPLALVGGLERRVRGVALAAGLFVTLALGSHTPVLEIAVRGLPPLGWFRFPEKYMLQASLALSLLAGSGLTRQIGGGRRGAGLLALPVALGAVVAAFGEHLRPLVASWSLVPNHEAALGALRAGGLQAALTGALGFGLLRALTVHPGGERRGPVLAGALVALVAADLLLANAPLLATADRALLVRTPSLAEVLQRDAAGASFRVFRDSTLDRTNVHREVQGAVLAMARNRATLGTSASVQAGIEDVFGYTAALTSMRVELVSSLFQHLDAWARRLDLRYLLVDATRPAQRLEPWLRSGLLEELLVDAATGVRVLRVRGTSSRLSCERQGTPVTPPEACGLVSRSPGRVEAALDLAAPATLVHGATHAPGWSATLDGRSVPLVAAHGILQGLEVPGGRHRVLLTYRTPGLAVGWRLSAATSAVLLAGWAVSAWRRRRGRGGPAA